MKKLDRKTAQAAQYPDKVIQFGEGNFLRAFVDWIIWKMNKSAGFNGGVVVVQPIDRGMVDMLNSQDGLYHLNLQGIDHGKPVDSIDLIDVINRGINPYREFEEYLELAEDPNIRFVISNTTEAGIAFDPDCRFDDRPASSYPGKLTQLLYHRFEYFKGDRSKGFIIFPCELIFLNGKELRKCVLQYIDLWNLGDDFKEWFETACGIYCTLVDRIVPGYPKDNIDEILGKIGYEDKLVDKAEIFHLWVIEAPEEIAKEFPADKAGLEVGDFIYSVEIDGEVTYIGSPAHFTELMSGTSPGDSVTITTVDPIGDDGTVTTTTYEDIVLVSSGSIGFLGVSSTTSGMTFVTPDAMMDRATDPFYGADTPFSYVSSLFSYLSGPFNGMDPVSDDVRWWYDVPAGDLFWMAVTLLYWIFWLDILLAISNALPTYVLDGGFIFAGGVSWLLEKIGVRDETRNARLTDSIAGSMSTLTLFLFLMVILAMLI